MSKKYPFHIDTSAITQQKSENNTERFWRMCGRTADERRYGDFEKSGVILNFYENRFLKNTDTQIEVKDPTASTREAFFVSYDKNVSSQNSRDDAIAKELPDGKNTQIRAKKIKYGNHNAMWEVISGHLYRLTGLNAPDTRMMICDEYEKDKIPSIYVASPLITGYYDLGDFLISETVIKSFITNEEDIKTWYEERDKIMRINPDSTNKKTISDQEKIARIKSMEKIYRLLPSYVHEEIEKSFAASKFIFNWDFANFNLNNIGVKFTFDRDRKVSSFESVFVDFGNSGAIGFGGKYKEISLDKANSEAKKQETSSTDYDPKISFTEAELNWIEAMNSQAQEEAKLNSQSITELEEKVSIAIKTWNRKYSNDGENKHIYNSVLFKSAHQIAKRDIKVEKISPFSGLLTISDLPRTLPFSFILKDSVNQKTNALVNDDLKNFYRDSEIEIAFRLSLIPPEAIKKLMEKWYLYQDFPEIFSANQATQYYTKTANVAQEEQEANTYEKAEKAAEAFEQRKNALINSIPREVVDRWAFQNQGKALIAEQQVNLAILQEIRGADPDFETRFTYESSEGDSSKSKSEDYLINTSRRSLTSPRSNATDRSSEDNQNTNPYVVIVSENSYQNRVARYISENPKMKKDLTKYAIKQMESIVAKINQHKKTLEKQRDYSYKQNASEKIATLESVLESAKDENHKKQLNIMIEEIEASKNAKEFLETAMIQENLIDFIRENSHQWNKNFELDPNSVLIDLERIRKMYRSRAYNDLAVAPDQILDEKQNSLRNKEIHDENCFIYDYVMKSLEINQAKTITNSPTTFRITASAPLLAKKENEIEI